MAFGKTSAADIPEQERKLLPEGFYPVTITKTETLETKASQGMLLIHCAPCKKDGDPKSAISTTSTHMLLSADWENDDQFREVKRERMAAKKSCDPDQITEGEIEEELAATKVRAFQSMSKAAGAIFGRSELPQTPRYDRDAKKFFDADGGEVPAQVWRDARKEQDAVACNLIGEIAAGDADVTGYVCYAKVVHETWNNNKNAKVKGLYETLPDGEKCVPVKSWGV